MAETVPLPLPKVIWEPCPHCGAKPHGLVRTDTQPGDWSVAMLCAGCGAMGGDGDTEAQAIALWNRRPSPKTGEVSAAAVEAAARGMATRLIGEETADHQWRAWIEDAHAALTAAMPFLTHPVAAEAVIEAASIEIERLRDLHCTRREAFEIIGDDDKAALLSDFVAQLAGLRDTISALAPPSSQEAGK